MIHVIVGSRHLQEILGYRTYHPALREVFYPALAEIAGRKLISVERESELAEWTVFDVLKDFHERACASLVANAPEILEARQKAIRDVALETYHLNDFDCTPENARDSLAIHGVFPHGSLSREGRTAYLPDVSIGARPIAFYASLSPTDREKLIHGIDAEFWAIYDAHKCVLSDFECHLCDTLDGVYRRAVDRWEELKNTNQDEAQLILHKQLWEEIDRRWFLNEFYDNYGKKTGGDDYLVIDAIIEGFTQYRALMGSLEAQWADVPSVANHRLLSAAATRRGLGKPVISRLFPVALWQAFEEPIKHFLLQASEIVGAKERPAVYPNLPTEQEMKDLGWALVDLARDDPSESSFDIAKHVPTLRKLGLEEAFENRPWQSPDPFERDKSGWDWLGVLGELESALYGNDIEKSLHLQETLDLYPLHKRVLGLVEHIIISNLKGKQFGGPASVIFTDAYVGEYDRTGTKVRSPLCSWGNNPNDRLCRRDGFVATHETEGNWLILAQDAHTRGTPAPLSLAGLLDGLIKAISLAPEVKGLGVKVRFKSLTPADQAKQIAALTQGSKQAACMSLYLGKIAIMLRNAIEHGLDEPVNDGLMIDCAGYWKEPRAPHDWNLRNSRKNKWRSQSSIPLQLPPTSNSFLLTPASLERCLALVSLVLKSSSQQLGL